MRLLVPGTYSFGAGDSTLSVMTGRAGAAAKAGHDLLIDVASWQATLEIGEDAAQSRIALDADGASLHVREGTGGIKPLDDDDKANIEATIDGILDRQRIQFRSTAVQMDVDAGIIRARGDLNLFGSTRPIAVDVVAGRDGRLTASVVLKQTDWGIKPYSTLFGALQVADEVKVMFEAILSANAPASKRSISTS